MNSSNPHADGYAAVPASPLTVVAGWESVLPVPERPIDAWIDLMEVVEALCPVWPEAVAGNSSRDYRL